MGRAPVSLRLGATASDGRGRPNWHLRHRDHVCGASSLRTRRAPTNERCRSTRLPHLEGRRGRSSPRSTWSDVAAGAAARRRRSCQGARGPGIIHCNMYTSIHHGHQVLDRGYVFKKRNGARANIPRLPPVSKAAREPFFKRLIGLRLHGAPQRTTFPQKARKTTLDWLSRFPTGGRTARGNQSPTSNADQDGASIPAWAATAVSAAWRGTRKRLPDDMATRTS